MTDGPGERRTPADRRYRPPDGLRLVFLAVLAMWVAIPFLIRGNLAQDALPYVVAGQLVGSDPGAVYASEGGDLYTLDPAFAAASCEAAPPGTDCSNLTVAFVSTPVAVPAAVVLSWLGPGAGVLVLRLVAAGSLALGMGVLWNRLAHRTPNAGRTLVVTALLLTPFATVPIVLGQTSPVLFASAAVGVVASARATRLVAATGLWVTAIVLKVFPAALGAVLLWQRRWRFVGVALVWTAVLVGVALTTTPTSLWSDFTRTTGELSVTTSANPFNGSVDALAHELLGVGDGAGSVVVAAVRVLLLVVLGWWAATHLDDDAQWAYAYLLVLLVVPLVWWHYLWVAVAAVGCTLAGRSRLDDRALLALPALALVTIPISIPYGQGRSLPIVQGLFLLAAIALVPALADRARVLPAWATRRAGEVADPRAGTG